MGDVQCDDLLYLTADQPGIGGRLKRRPEDFLVEEVPLFEPTGEGEHLYLWVEKRRRLTTDITRLLAQHFGVPQRDVGFAGLKDKHAITRQAVTIRLADIDKVAEFQDDHIRILWAERHSKKLKRGNLRGNRFNIRIRDVDPASVVRARTILDRLVIAGCPNYLGEQRFGYRQNNHILGRHLLLKQWQQFLDALLGGPQIDDSEQVREARQAYTEGDYERALSLWPKVHRFERQAIGPLSRGAPPYDAVHGIDHMQLTLLVSAFQSHVFNRVLNRRLRDGLFDRLVEGDVAMKRENRAMFDVLDPQAEQPRMDAGDIAPSGPMWGESMKPARGQVAEWEQQALHSTGLSEADLAEGPYAPDGSRRPLRMMVQDVDISAGADEHGPYVHVAFMLPRGSFATVVMREIMKVDADDDSSDD